MYVKLQHLGAYVGYRVCAAHRRISEAALCLKQGLFRIRKFSHSFRNYCIVNLDRSSPQDEEKSSRK